MDYNAHFTRIWTQNCPTAVDRYFKVKQSNEVRHMTSTTPGAPPHLMLMGHHGLDGEDIRRAHTMFDSDLQRLCDPKQVYIERGQGGFKAFSFLFCVLERFGRPLHGHIKDSATGGDRMMEVIGWQIFVPAMRWEAGCISNAMMSLQYTEHSPPVPVLKAVRDVGKEEKVYTDIIRGHFKCKEFEEPLSSVDALMGRFEVLWTKESQTYSIAVLIAVELRQALRLAGSARRAHTRQRTRRLTPRIPEELPRYFTLHATLIDGRRWREDQRVGRRVADDGCLLDDRAPLVEKLLRPRHIYVTWRLQCDITCSASFCVINRSVESSGAIDLLFEIGCDTP
ncbi:hypothetical protein RvY_04664 [Ramazzottius varieornatus]|uniref:Uncharacterized protein n=1 Tax=Ramazzottius varieornatus TaxID=947166 RepID=A0A1D1UZ34_RAMVA|nr:hypothetical protein RvY_04664 [Ramazzottius varieornatus]